MSYLERPRLHFAGRFEADVSTVNNNPANYNDATFLPEYDTPGVPIFDDTGAPMGDMTNGWWNPTGTGVWRLLNCSVREACSAHGDVDPSDRIYKMLVTDADTRPPAKIVDLDPMQQSVSTIFGLQIRLEDQETGETILAGEFAPAPFTNLWFLRSPQGDAAALYQSQLHGVGGGGPAWSDSAVTSPFLRELRGAAHDEPLSVRFVLDAMVGNSKNELFPTGRIVGAIGVAHKYEPRHFVRGRQLLVPLDLKQPRDNGYGKPVVANVNEAVAITTDSHLIVDVANTLQVSSPGAALNDVGTISIGTVAPDGTFTAIGVLPASYKDQGWLEQTSGIVEIPVGEHAATVASTPIALCLASAAPGGAAQIYPIESPNGEYVRADAFVFRAEPQEAIKVELYTTKFGRTFDTDVAISIDPLDSYLNVLQPRLSDPFLPGPPGLAGPAPGQPQSALRFPSEVTTRSGKAILTIETLPPKNPRGYIDGQVYTVRPTISGSPEFVNQADTISILLFDETKTPTYPTWWDDIQPIFQQYANLYPIMRKVLDLDDYASVVAHKEMLAMVFCLPETHPNYMPVSRDLSPSKRRMILKWLAAASEPALGAAPPRLSAPSSKLRYTLKSPKAQGAYRANGAGDGDIGGKSHVREILDRNLERTKE